MLLRLTWSQMMRGVVSCIGRIKLGLFLFSISMSNLIGCSSQNNESMISQQSTRPKIVKERLKNIIWSLGDDNIPMSCLALFMYHDSYAETIPVEKLPNIKADDNTILNWSPEDKALFIFSRASLSSQNRTSLRGFVDKLREINVKWQYSPDTCIEMLKRLMEISDLNTYSQIQEELIKNQGYFHTVFKKYLASDSWFSRFTFAYAHILHVKSDTLLPGWLLDWGNGMRVRYLQNKLSIDSPYIYPMALNAIWMVGYDTFSTSHGYIPTKVSRQLAERYREIDQHNKSPQTETEGATTTDKNEPSQNIDGIAPKEPEK
jgi:hypothetical protein